MLKLKHCHVLKLTDPKFRIVMLLKLIIYELSPFNKFQFHPDPTLSLK